MSTRPTGAITDGHSRVVRDPAVAQAEAELAEAREQVTESMMALREEVARRTDWRGWIGRRPGLALGVAFGLGLLLGTRGRGWRPEKESGGWSWR
jgi:hypothetical protein